MNLTRIRRLLQLISLLQAGRAYNTEALAQASSVSRRTIFRDLDVLRSAGIPLVYDENHERYQIAGTRLLPPTTFTPEEALVLIVLCHDLGDQLPAPFFRPARSAALKLESNMPARLLERVQTTSQAVHIQMMPTNRLAGQEPLYEQLIRAVSEHRSVRMWYHSLAESKELCTRLNPYRQLFSRRSWYAIGRSSVHRATRTFNVGRIRKLELLEDGYQVPRGFSLSRYLRNAWHLIPERGPDQQVVVRFDRAVAENVAEVTWHKTQEVHFNPDGSLDFRVTVSGLSEISWWILGYGDRAEVLEPDRLREMVAGHAARMVQRYQNATE
jgi:predicted DNA-binding transcriptional regulator YafY